MRQRRQNCYASLNTLTPEEVYDDIKQAYADELIENGVIRLEDVEATLERGKERVLDELSHNQRYCLITDTIKEMEGWACFRSNDRLSSPSRNITPVGQSHNVAPVVQPSTKKQQQKAKHKRKPAKASRRKNRR